MKNGRPEEEVLRDLEVLAGSPGYIHAIAHLCFRDNFVSYSPEDTPEQFAKLYSSSRLIRTEISVLIGLMVKTRVDFSLPTPAELDHYIQRTEELLEELHECLNLPMFEALRKVASGAPDGDDDLLSSGSALREPIFYGAESAYTFQYRDLVIPKYSSDDAWLLADRGFSIADAQAVVKEVGRLSGSKLVDVLRGLRGAHPNEWIVLPAFEVETTELATNTGLPHELVEKILRAFSLPSAPCNESFSHINDFNFYNAAPLIPANPGKYISLQHHSLLEALYESPFFWMLSDKGYADRATLNRGAYLEQLSYDFLVRVFGKDRVWANVLIIDEQGNRAAEIDTLVVFGSRAIVVQAKSKRLTLEARKGSDKMMKDDFAKSVQASYDQGIKCAELLEDPKYHLISADSAQQLELSQQIERIYVFCLISDHYPALSAQTRQFLQTRPTERIPAPFVMDVFLLDAMTEMLRSPLYFLSYVDRRVNYNDRVLASHELTILSYHLKLNLWIDKQFHMFQLGDDISTDLDLAMMVRREGIEGPDTPEGILTKLKGTTFEKIIEQISQDPRENAVDLGMFLLSMSGEASDQLSNAIDQLTAQALLDGEPHDFTIGFAGEGLTVHVSDQPISTAQARLRRHCEIKKYQQRAKTWLGVLISPNDKSIRMIGKLSHQWRRDPRIEEIIASTPGTKRYIKPLHEDGRKVGRNDPCVCGSGKKFKRCCL